MKIMLKPKRRSSKLQFNISIPGRIECGSIEEFEVGDKVRLNKKAIKITTYNDYVIGTEGTITKIIYNDSGKGLHTIEILWDGKEKPKWLGFSCKGDNNHLDLVFKGSNNEWGINEFEVGKWYVCQFKNRPGDSTNCGWCDEEKDEWFDGKPHKCIEFIETTECGNYCLVFNDIGDWCYSPDWLGNFKEVPPPRD